MPDAITQLLDRIAQLHRHLAVVVACPVCDAPAFVACDSGEDAPHLPRLAAAEFWGAV